MIKVIFASLQLQLTIAFVEKGGVATSQHLVPKFGWAHHMNMFPYLKIFITFEHHFVHQFVIFVKNINFMYKTTKLMIS